MINCHLCEKSFAIKQNLYRHLRNIHRVEIVKTSAAKCVQSTFATPSVSKMKDHVEGVHSLETKFCVYCSKTFSGSKDFNSHLRTAH